MMKEEFPSNLAIKGNKPIHKLEVVIVKEDGRKIWTEVSATPLSLPNKIYAIVTNDITERKQAGESLRIEKENFRNSLDDSPLGVRIVTAEGNTIYANKTVLNIYGYDSLEELQKISLKNRYTPESYTEAKKRKQQRKRVI